MAINGQRKQSIGKTHVCTTSTEYILLCTPPYCTYVPYVFITPTPIYYLRSGTSLGKALAEANKVDILRKARLKNAFHTRLHVVRTQARMNSAPPPSSRCECARRWRGNEEEHVQKFWKSVKLNKFCSVDAEEVLKDQRWTELFREL